MGVPRLARADFRAGIFLVGLMLIYGLVIDVIGRPPLSQLQVSLGNFAALSFYAGVLTACAFALLCMVRPSTVHSSRRARSGC